jgi:hypothetical protein
MKQTLTFAALIGVAIGLVGCAEIEKFEDFIDSPKTQQAAATLEKGATALVCSIANAAAVAAQIETAIDAGQSAQGTDGKLYVSSAIVCTSLGGKVTGSAVVQ